MHLPSVSLLHEHKLYACMVASLELSITTIKFTIVHVFWLLMENEKFIGHACNYTTCGVLYNVVCKARLLQVESCALCTLHFASTVHYS